MKIKTKKNIGLKEVILSLTFLLIPVIVYYTSTNSIAAVKPGSLKAMPSSNAKRDASGTGQLFESINVPNLTDFPEGTNGFVFADLDKNGFLDIVTVTTEPFALDKSWNEKDGNVSRTRDPKDKLRVLMNYGGFNFKPHKVTIKGSKATPDDLGQGWRGSQIPNAADFNNDGFLDLFITRQSPMRNGKFIEGKKPVGNSLFLSDGAFYKFKDQSVKYGALNEYAYNRQVSLGDVNLDGFIDIALGADNIVNAFEGIPKESLYVFRSQDGTFSNGHYKDIGNTSLIPDFGGYHQNSLIDKAGPNIALRDIDNDGDLDLLHSAHSLINGGYSPFLPHSPGEYRQGVFTYRNLLNETSKFHFKKSTNNGLADEARLIFDKRVGRFIPETSKRAPGLAYMFFGDVTNNGLFDVLLVDGSDYTFKPMPEDIGGRFWYNLGDFRFKEATARAGLSSLSYTYEDWYSFFDAEIPKKLTIKSKLKKFRVTQPGLKPQRPIDFRPYHGDVIFADYNNDTWLDFILLDRREAKILETRSVLYLNQGNGVFKPTKTTFSGLDSSGISGEAADLNNDGLVDLLIASDPDNTGQVTNIRRYEDKVYLNTGLHGARKNNWLRLRFSGINHSELLGARIEIFDSKTKKRIGTRGIYSNQSYKSGSPLEAHFGLGKTKSVDVLVFIVGNKVQRFNNIQGNRYLDLNLNTRKVVAVKF